MSLRASEFRRAMQGFRGVLREQVSLAPLTHIRIGGPAEFYLEPATEDDVVLVVKACRELNLPLHCLGGGSNVVVADAGMPGVVLSLAKLNRVVQDENRITAGAGVSLPSLIRSTKDIGLAGLELLIGIPAQLGGAVAMNAGTRDGETFDHLVSLTLVDAEGRLHSMDKASMQPSYRDGGLGDQLVLQGTFELQKDDSQEIFQRMENSLKRRNATQPVTQRSVGCVFTNPEGDSAGRMIEGAGCKLLRCGNVSVSGKHANYFINEGEGTCEDFLALLNKVQQQVADKFAVQLQPEVKVWGF